MAEETKDIEKSLSEKIKPIDLRGKPEIEKKYTDYLKSGTLYALFLIWYYSLGIGMSVAMYVAVKSTKNVGLVIMFAVFCLFIFFVVFFIVHGMLYSKPKELKIVVELSEEELVEKSLAM
ncbi:hypothetical protein MHBO_000001 [Bonamia ostreae]|uniref:Uncharacterized protein n=1 Tax=Bonamia ostreae TaxID=126728 RepID=A0ABV2AFE4_9EUKA